MKVMKVMKEAKVMKAMKAMKAMETKAPKAAAKAILPFPGNKRHEAIFYKDATVYWAEHGWRVKPEPGSRKTYMISAKVKPRSEAWHSVCEKLMYLCR